MLYKCKENTPKTQSSKNTLVPFFLHHRKSTSVFEDSGLRMPSYLIQTHNKQKTDLSELLLMSEIKLNHTSNQHKDIILNQPSWLKKEDKGMQTIFDDEQPTYPIEELLPSKINLSPKQKNNSQHNFEDKVIQGMLSVMRQARQNRKGRYHSMNSSPDYAVNSDIVVNQEIIEQDIISRPIGSYKRPKHRNHMKKRILSIPDITLPSIELSPKISPLGQKEILNNSGNNQFYLPQIRAPKNDKNTHFFAANKWKV